MKVELLYSDRHQREQIPVKPAQAANPLQGREYLQKRRLERLASISFLVSPDAGVNQTEKIGFWKQMQHLRQDLLGAGVGDEPLVDKCYAQDDPLTQMLSDDQQALLCCLYERYRKYLIFKRKNSLLND